ncbi:MAG TPA: glycosyltransferase family 1 protein [Candidatus Acidoferrales bacterium]|jgi:glycosyltransferase involved in cell wall biosynthesis|nr:glycosyltransferase family 1 protein [Candidatus Acidoferrales bacterium]
MKIGLSTSVIQRGKTGIAEYVFSLVRAFEAHADTHQFVLFVLEGDLPLFEFAKGYAQLITVSEKFRPPLKDIFWHQLILPRLVRTHGLDVLHVPSYRRLLWRKPCALTATIHDLAAFHVNEKYDWKRMFYGRVIARYLVERQDEIIAISRNTARDIENFWKLPGRNISVVHHGMDHERFFPVEPEIAKATGWKHFSLRQPFFLYVARLEHPAKNHLRLIAAFEAFKEATNSPWQLVLAGSDWHGAEAIHAMVDKSEYAANIHRLGFVPAAELPLLYRAADVFVYPSLYEGFGFPPLEAMACGCPVLCSARGALGEIVSDAAAIVDPEDASALKFQLARLAADAGLRQRLRTAGLERARQFNWERAAVQTLDIYARAADRKTVQTSRNKAEFNTISRKEGAW